MTDIDESVLDTCNTGASNNHRFISTSYINLNVMPTTSDSSSSNSSSESIDVEHHLPLDDGALELKERRPISTDRCLKSSETQQNTVAENVKRSKPQLSSHLPPGPFSATHTRLISKERARLFHLWRKEALDFIARRRNVFILEVFTIEDSVLQVKMASSDITMSLNTDPWSMKFARSMSKEEFKMGVKKCSAEVNTVLNLQTVKFSPSRLVRFVLNNSEGVPAILSSNYTNLMNRKNGLSFIEYFVCKKILPGSQRCCHQGCKRMATAVKVDVEMDPINIYCSRHVRNLGMEDKVMLYNPLLVAFTPHKKHVTLSAMDVQEVYGPRYGSWSTLSEGTAAIPLPRKWTPLCRKPQYRQLRDNMKPIEMFYETARNVLDCAVDHFRRSKHFVGVDVRHSITTCLVETFLARSGHVDLCEFSLEDEPSKQDLPYKWSDHRS